jgi:hypothetical protein
VKPVIVDTGFLVCLFLRDDLHREAAKRYLAGHKHPLITVAPVVVETCFFLRPSLKVELLTWIRRGAMSVAEVPADAYPPIELTLHKYADQDIDFADAALIWLANESGVRRILTTDRSDFSTFGLKGGKRFELIEWL